MDIAVLLSGGVDSSLALQLLHEQKEHNLKAYYLKIWLEDEVAYLGDCPWEEDMSYARAVCEKLDIPLEVIPLQTEYHDRVVSFAIEELKAGRTPSPDIFCNERIKFGAFFEKLSQTHDKVASGHYAQVEKIGKQYFLKRAPDPVKDQTYFLSNLSQDQLSKILFPIGHLTKTQVRELAKEYDLATQSRKDSQGICFLGKIQYRDFVKFHLGVKEGNIVEKESDKVLGKHEGFWFHTIGQRKGLGLGGGPWYVVGKDLSENIVYVSHADYQTDQSRDTLQVGEINWINAKPTKSNLQIKLRHGPQLIACDLELENDIAKLKLSDSDPGIAPGQHVIFYDNEICLGGGRILSEA